MRTHRSRMVLYLVSFLIAGMGVGVMQADQIVGSLPLVGLDEPIC